MPTGYDFSGWATRNNVKCSDGRTIRKDAFKHQDGDTVPLVYNHNHNDLMQVVGHAILENREDGVYTYGYLNDTELGQTAKELIQHGDITSLSIYANHLRQNGGDVLHGAIREVSLVLAGANPGAYIDAVMKHSDDGYDEGEGRIYNGFEGLEFEHADNSEEENKKEEPKMAENKEKTVGDVIDSMNEEQKAVLEALVGQAVADTMAKYENGADKEDNMKHNAFNEKNEERGNVLSHADVEAIFNEAKSHHDSLRETCLAHGIEGIETLFPEPKTLNNTPEIIDRSQDWVKVVMAGVHKNPFSRIKSSFANLTEDEARAKGYIKGHLKKEQVFSLLKRRTDPQTIYKKQKLDRDDILDIKDFDVVALIRGEMRYKLEEEIARAILFGDGRLSSDEDKISEDHIRPVWKDEDLFTIKCKVTIPTSYDENDRAKALIKGIKKSRKGYKGSGRPVLFTSEDTLCDMLLVEDKNGRVIYENEEQLANALRVSKIVTVPFDEDLIEGGFTLDALIVNLNDYALGADKGGEVSMFEDFDIDYNQEKYLIETRCSGALVKPFSAIAVSHKVDGTSLVISSTTMAEAIAAHNEAANA